MSDWRLEYLTLFCLKIVDCLFWYRVFFPGIFRNFLSRDGLIDDWYMKVFRSRMRIYWLYFGFFLKISCLLSSGVIFLFRSLMLSLTRINLIHHFLLVLIVKLTITLMILRSLMRTLLQLRILYNRRQDSVIHKARPVWRTVVRRLNHFNSPMPSLFLIRSRPLSSMLFRKIRRRWFQF